MCVKLQFCSYIFSNSSRSPIETYHSPLLNQPGQKVSYEIEAPASIREFTVSLFCWSLLQT
jgi:hypothetical protein